MTLSNGLADRAFVAYATAALLLCLNLLFLWMASAFVRAKSKTAVNEEDAATFGSALVASDPPAVARVLRAHSNAQASIFPFLLLGLVYVLSGAHPTFAGWLFGIFTLARWLHSFAYLKGLQPWRTVFFLTGIGCLVVLMATLAWRLLQGV